MDFLITVVEGGEERTLRVTGLDEELLPRLLAALEDGADSNRLIAILGELETLGLIEESREVRALSPEPLEDLVARFGEELRHAQVQTRALEIEREGRLGPLDRLFEREPVTGASIHREIAARHRRGLLRNRRRT